MDIQQAKDFLHWCRENGVYHVELDNLKADIMPELQEVPKPTDENSFNHIPMYAPSILEDIQHTELP